MIAIGADVHKQQCTLAVQRPDGKLSMLLLFPGFPSAFFDHHEKHVAQHSLFNVAALPCLDVPQVQEAGLALRALVAFGVPRGPALTM